MPVPRRPWQPREAVATRRSRLLAISKGAGIAALVLFVVTGATVAGIIGSNQHHGVTPAAAAALPSSSSTVVAADPGSSASTVATGTTSVTASTSSSSPAAVVAVAQPKSQGQPGIVPVPLAPHATAGPIPLLAWQAYHRAAAGSGCNLPWYLLAGIGKIESNHGRYGGAQFDVTGTVHPSIFGPPTAYGRAMGPMQFIPPTWASYAADGNGDDITNPQNIFDATKAAAHYLCRAGGPDLSGLAAQRRAVFAYNHLDSYVADVLAFAAAYQHGQPEKVVHLVPIVYPKPAAKAAAPSTTHSAASSSAAPPATGTRSEASATPTLTPPASPTSTTAASTTDSTTDPRTTAPPTTVPPTTVPTTTATCVTTSSPPPTSAAPTTSALPSTVSRRIAAVPMRTTTASSTTLPGSATSPPSCPPCPTSTPTPTSTPGASPTATTCPTTPAPTTTAPTTTATGQKRTSRLTPGS